MRWTTVSQLAEDFRVSEFPVFDDPDANGGNVGLLHPAGQFFLKCEIDWFRSDVLCVRLLNASHKTDEKQAQGCHICWYDAHS